MTTPSSVSTTTSSISSIASTTSSTTPTPSSAPSPTPAPLAEPTFADITTVTKNVVATDTLTAADELLNSYLQHVPLQRQAKATSELRAKIGRKLLHDVTVLTGSTDKVYALMDKVVCWLEPSAKPIRGWTKTHAGVTVATSKGCGTFQNYAMLVAALKMGYDDVAVYVAKTYPLVGDGAYFYFGKYKRWDLYQLLYAKKDQRVYLSLYMSGLLAGGHYADFRLFVVGDVEPNQDNVDFQYPLMRGDFDMADELLARCRKEQTDSRNRRCGPLRLFVPVGGSGNTIREYSRNYLTFLKRKVDEAVATHGAATAKGHEYELFYVTLLHQLYMNEDNERAMHVFTAAYARFMDELTVAMAPYKDMPQYAHVWQQRPYQVDVMTYAPSE